MSDPAYWYALHAKCGGGCMREVMGPARRSDGPEFPPQVLEKFDVDLRELGWIQSEKGVWSCGEKCPGPFRLDPSQFEMRQGLKTRYKIKVINPDFYGTATVENL